MKKSFVFFFACFICMQINAQDKKPIYDSVLAKKSGADDYGMKSYVLAILKTGSYTAKDKKESGFLFCVYMNNIIKLTTGGELTVASLLGKYSKKIAVII